MVPGRKVALIRGLNVGKARRITMPELRAVIEALGYCDIQTLLNSGNAMFTARGVRTAQTAGRIADALTARMGVDTRVAVLTAAELDTVVRENPFVETASNPSRLLVAFPSDTRKMSRLKPLLDLAWTPESLGLGSLAAYLWCPEGVLASRLLEAVARALGDSVTTRNWATVTKLHALVLG